MSSISDKVAALPGYTSERVVVPEWDGIEFEIRSLTVAARAQFVAAWPDDDSEDRNVEAQLVIVVATAFDPDNGDLAFTVDDIPMLKTQNAAAIDRLYGVAARLNGFSEDAVDLGKGDSSSTTTGDTSSS